MTREERLAAAGLHWLKKAHECLASARSELEEGRVSFAVNRSYYAAFYAASAVLLLRGHRFSKHAGVRSALHRHLVQPGLLSKEQGKDYDDLFDDRQEGDYVEFVEFRMEEGRRALARAESLVASMEELLPRKGP